VNVHVEYRRANQVYEDVLSNVVDLGLVAYPVKDSKLEIIPCARSRWCSSAIRSIRSPNKNPSSSRLAGQKFIGFEPDIPTRKALDKILKEYGVEVKHVMEFDNVETVKRAVEIDAGISIVPLGTVTRKSPSRRSPPCRSRTANFSVRSPPSTKRTRCFRRR
jgi:LysR family transcriptional regulator, transcriptional activator of the cysJI operon